MVKIQKIQHLGSAVVAIIERDGKVMARRFPAQTTDAEVMAAVLPKETTQKPRSKKKGAKNA